MSMMSLGMFVFELKTLPFQQTSHDTSWRHPTSSRVGARPAGQFLGPGDETMNLSGVLLPEITGGEEHLDMVRDMGDKGDAYPLLNGQGFLLGLYVVESVKVQRGTFFADGIARRLEFTLELRRVDDDKVDQLGRIYA